VAYHPNYKWINPTYPIYNWGYNPLTKWDEPPSISIICYSPFVKLLGIHHPCKGKKQAYFIIHLAGFAVQITFFSDFITIFAAYYTFHIRPSTKPFNKSNIAN
jgi:hypothetical protein